MSDSLPELIRTTGRSAVSLVLPLYCLGCAREGDVICIQCAAQLPKLELPFCRVCADPGVQGVCRDCRQLSPQLLGNLVGIRAPFLMEGLLREAIHSFKFRNYRAASPCLAELLADYLDSNPLPGDVLLPVPLHQKKLRERGYNQAALLARELGKRVGIPVEEKLLVRTRHTSPQVAAPSAAQRRTNAEGAFSCRTGAAGRNIILVDDVCTSSATLRSCAAALKAGGAASVWALTLARESLPPASAIA